VFFRAVRVRARDERIGIDRVFKPVAVPVEVGAPAVDSLKRVGARREIAILKKLYLRVDRRVGVGITENDVTASSWLFAFGMAHYFRVT